MDVARTQYQSLVAGRRAMLPYLDDAQVRKLLRLEDLIPAMEQALLDFSAGRIAQPARQMLAAPSPGGHFAAMPAAGTAGMGAKLVTIYPANAALGLPTHLALIVLFRPETGEPLAIMDGRLITELRTAAVSAVATQVLSRPDARVLAILGSGVQAHGHVQALRLVRDFTEIRVWSRTRANAERFAAETGAVLAATAEAAVRGADVIVTATAATSPVLAGAWLKSGAHVNAIGWAGPKGRELDDAAMHESLVIVDTREGVMNESGDVLLSGAAIHAELGEILAGTRSVPPGATTVFESVGMAVEDVAAAQLVYDRLAIG
jgi:ornithine cyclodeaminase/alanine dehydrogenase-like protein (mu-crystallin family)